MRIVETEEFNSWIILDIWICKTDSGEIIVQNDTVNKDSSQ